MIYASARTQRYRKLVERTTTNYSSFFFKRLRDLGSSYAEIIDTIKSVKAEMEGAIEALTNDLSDQICELFGAAKSTPLGMLITRKYEANWAAKRQKSFDYYTNAFLEFSSGVQASERDYEVILRLAKIITGLELMYWNDTHKTEFMNCLSEIDVKLSAYSVAAGLSEHETRMTLVTSSGQEKSIVFDRNELSGLSKTVKNKINATFANYGLSISYDEKVQILLTLIEDMLEGK